MKKKDREEAELQEVRNAINEEKNYIRIEPDERKRKDKKD